MKVAVVGSGVSGLAATWLLNEYSDHTVHLYEADSRAGGHAHTVRYTPKNIKRDLGKEGIDVDTGFIVFNPTTYPNFLRFLRMHASTDRLILPTEMTFSVSRDGGAFEWAGKNLFTVFCQAKNLLNPEMWRLVWDVARFNATAGRILLEGDQKQSIGEYLDREGYSLSFRDNYLIPMTAAIWSTPADQCAMNFPARTLIHFMHNHHLLQITGKPSWLTLKGGSKAYVNQILSNLDKRCMHLSTPVQSLTRLPHINEGSTSQILLKTLTGVSETYDHVILACHSDDAVRILRNGVGIEGGYGITSLEETILSSFEWNTNEVVLHSDVRLMPKSRAAWSCWNYLTKSGVDKKGKKQANSDDVSLTYGMNDLQHIPESKYGPVLVTLNAPFEPREDLVAGRWKYDHPLLDGKAVAAQQRMHEIQGIDGISFAGAYLRYGFHEDGFTSGLVAAAALSSQRGVDDKSVCPPFPIEYAAQDVRRTLTVRFVAGLFDLCEASGTRVLVGLLGSAMLGVFRSLFLL